MSAPSGLLKTAEVGTTMASFTVFAVMERLMVIPGRNAGSGFDASTHTSMVVLPGSSAGLTRVTRPFTGSSRPATLSSAGCRL